jgi:hypothetical protein
MYVCMYARVYVCAYMCICIYTHIHIHTYIHIYAFTACIRKHIHTKTNYITIETKHRNVMILAVFYFSGFRVYGDGNIQAQIALNVTAYICVCMYMYLCMYVCVYVYEYIHTYIHTFVL